MRKYWISASAGMTEIQAFYQIINPLKIERIYKKDERLSSFVGARKFLLTNTEKNFKNDKIFSRERSDED